MIEIAYVIATYNSEKTILNTIESASRASLKEKIKFEIVIVDDCSQDKTFSLLKKISKSKKYLKIMKNKKNLGFSKSIFFAAKFAKAKKLKILHAGNIENSKDIRKYIKKSKLYDVVLTNFIDKRNFFRKTLSSFCSILFCLASKKKIKYFNSAILCNRELFLKFYPKNFKGNFFLSVVIASFLIFGYNYSEVKVYQKHPPKGSKAVSLTNFVALFHALYLVFKLRLFNK